MALSAGACALFIFSVGVLSLQCALLGGDREFTRHCASRYTCFITRAQMQFALRGRSGRFSKNYFPTLF